MSKQITQFLENHSFFNYLEHKEYVGTLNQQIISALSKYNETQIHCPKKWEDIQKVQLNKDFIAMDLGGTNLKIYLCHPGKDKTTAIEHDKIDFYQNKIYTPEILFADLKKHLDSLFKKDETPPNTLVFSFANALAPYIRKKNRLDGKILFWGKNHSEKGLIGIHLGEEFEKYLHKNGYPEIKVHVANDSCIALLSTHLTQKLATSTIFNLIVGTGTNICVGYNHKSSFKLTNLEFGNFDFIPYSTFDNEINHQSATPNKFRTEKLFAGTWQNKLFNLIVQVAIKEGVIEKPANLKDLQGMSSLELEETFSDKRITKRDKILLPIWDAIADRGSFICALTITQLMNYLAQNGFTDKGITILEVGAILENSIKFRKGFEKTLQTLISENLHTESIKIEKYLTPEPTIDGCATLLKLYK
jgi:hexokinase